MGRHEDEALERRLRAVADMLDQAAAAVAEALADITRRTEGGNGDDQPHRPDRPR